MDFNHVAAGVSAADLDADLSYVRAKDKADKSLEIYKFFVNSLYVARLIGSPPGRLRLTHRLARSAIVTSRILPRCSLTCLATKEALQKLLRSPSALSRARSSLAYLPDMSRDSLRGFAHLGLLATIFQSFPNCVSTAARKDSRCLRVICVRFYRDHAPSTRHR